MSDAPSGGRWLARSTLLVLFLGFTQCLYVTDESDDNMPPRKPPVRVLEPRGGTWQNNVGWGNSYNGPMPASEGVEVPVLNWDGGYGPPKVYSVNLSSSSNIGDTNSDVRAHVRFGLGAFRGEFLADWFNGSQFSLVCDSLRITARTYNPVVYNDYDPTDGNITIGASIAAGTVSTYPLTYTEPAFQLAHNFNSDFLYIPAYAKGVMVHMNGNSDPSVNTDVTLSLKSGFVSGSISEIEYDLRMFAANPNGILLPAAMVRSKIENRSGVSKTFRVQWILGL